VAPKKGRVMNRIVAGIDLGDSESLVTVLSPGWKCDVQVLISDE